MHPYRFIAAVCVFAVAATLSVPAASPRDSLLVSTAWLAEHLKDPNLVLLQVDKDADYKAAHIPGAQLVKLNEQLARNDDEHKVSLEMLPADVLRQNLAAMGISDNSHIVVIHGKGWLTVATRVLFTLDYAGLGAKASFLDGGLPAWTRDGHDVTATETPQPKPGTLAPLKIQPVVVDAAFVQAHLKTKGFAIVDAREPVFYDGLMSGAARTAPPKMGHIPGAVSIPVATVTTDQSTWKSSAELAAAFNQAGVKPGDTVVGYCHVGQFATAMLLAARTLGFNVMLYDGSFEDWAHRDLPTEMPAGRGGAPR